MFFILVKDDDQYPFYSHESLPFLDSAIFMYLIFIGEQETLLQNMNESDPLTSTLSWAIYFVATFMLQVTFLNMLIAILSKIYDNVTE